MPIWRPLTHPAFLPLLSYVCHRITEIEGDFIIILYFISLRCLTISMAISYIYIRRHTYESSETDPLRWDFWNSVYTWVKKIDCARVCKYYSGTVENAGWKFRTFLSFRASHVWSHSTKRQQCLLHSWSMQAHAHSLLGPAVIALLNKTWNIWEVKKYLNRAIVRT